MTVRWRSTIRRIHLWLSMAVGLICVVLGLTGAALVFYIEIDEALHAELRATTDGPAPDWDSPVWDQALASARLHWPDPAGAWSFEVTGRGGAIPARYYPPAHSGNHHHAEREMVWFSADGAHVLRAEPWGGYLMSWLYELHANLLTAEIGRQVAGWSGFIVLIILVTGVMAWWPRKSWRKALAFKRGAAPIRRLRDLHKLTGLWSAIVLFLLAATGALLALPDIKTRLLNLVVAPDEIPQPVSASAIDRQVPIATALAAAHRALPDAHFAFIDVPGADEKPFRIRMQSPGDPHRRFPGSFVFVDQYTGQVLAVHDVRNGNASTAISKWIRPLHDGSVGGFWTRVLTVIAGLIPTVLFITGVLHWLHRRRSERPSPQKTHTILTRSIS